MTSSAINAGWEGGLSPPPLLIGASRKEGLARVQQWLKVFIDFAPNVSVCTEWGTVNKYHGGSRIQIEQVARTARSVEGRCDGIMEGAILNTWGLLLVVTTCHLLILYGPAISWWTPSTDLLALASSVPRRSFLHSNVAGVILDLKQEQKRRQMQILYSNFQTSLPVPPLRVLYSCLSREGGRPQMQFFEPIFHNIFQKSDRNPRTHATHLLPRAYDGRNRVTILMCKYFLRLTL